MNAISHRRSRPALVASLLLVLAYAPQAEQDARAESPPPNPDSACLDCHQIEDMEVDLASGEKQRLYVDEAALAASVHAKLACTDCHADLKGKAEGHDPKPFRTAREFTIAYSEQCKQCHFANYTKTLDSVHHALIAKGKLNAAVCADCHGAHDMAPAAEPRSRISKTCARCHQKVATIYAKSVHGKALLSGENPDVPACTDCHRSHDIVDPRAGSWRLRSPQMCAGCHTNERMMKKYKLSTNVLSTYLSDFHGTTTLLQEGEQGAKPAVALCTDCHGVHDITKVNAPSSKVLQANLVQTCKKCHPGASANFPAAWLSHYEPTWEKAPLVYAVKVVYSILIPFMIAGLLLQIALHLWRVVVNR